VGSRIIACLEKKKLVRAARKRFYGWYLTKKKRRRKIGAIRKGLRLLPFGEKDMEGIA